MIVHGIRMHHVCKQVHPQDRIDVHEENEEGANIDEGGKCYEEGLEDDSKALPLAHELEDPADPEAADNGGGWAHGGDSGIAGY